MLNLLRRILDGGGVVGPATGDATGAEGQSDARQWWAIEAILLEYDVQTRDRRLYAQSMFGTIGFVVAGTVALLAAATKDQPEPLLLVPPLLLAGGVLTVVLRIHLLRVSVFLTVVEEDLRRRLEEPSYPIVWETTMTGRTEAVTAWSSPARSSAGLSLSLMLILGVGLTTVLVWPTTLFYWHAETGLINEIANLLSVPAVVVEWAYPVVNLVLLLYIAYAWVRQPAVLESARIHFRRTRSRIVEGTDDVILRSDVGVDGQGGGTYWSAQWEGIRDRDRVALEHAVGIPSRPDAEGWARKRAVTLTWESESGSG